MTISYAPIALFTFKRSEHTRHTLESLAQNPEFAASPLFIFCDGARNATEADPVEKTRELVRAWGNHPNKTVIERDRNWGLANSIIAGVTKLCERYGRVIVVEDDLIVSPVFLRYLNSALDHYADESKVMQVSAHMFPVTIQSPCDALMLPFTTSWGWATWARAWKHFKPNAILGYEKLKTNRSLRHRFDLNGTYPYFRMLKRQLEGKVDSWAIRWYLCVFMIDGLVVFPLHSLVRHDGYDDTATHAARRNQSVVNEVWKGAINVLPRVAFDHAAFSAVTTFFRKDRSLFNRLKRRFGFD